MSRPAAPCDSIKLLREFSKPILQERAEETEGRGRREAGALIQTFGGAHGTRGIHGRAERLEIKRIRSAAVVLLRARMTGSVLMNGIFVFLGWILAHRAFAVAQRFASARRSFESVLA